MTIKVGSKVCWHNHHTNIVNALGVIDNRDYCVINSWVYPVDAVELYADYLQNKISILQEELNRLIKEHQEVCAYEEALV